MHKGSSTPTKMSKIDGKQIQWNIKNWQNQCIECQYEKLVQPITRPGAPDWKAMVILEAWRNQSNYISLEWSWQKLSKKVIFIKFEQFYQKWWVFKWNFASFYHNHSQNAFIAWIVLLFRNLVTFTKFFIKF